MTSSSPPLSGLRMAERRAFKKKENAQERSPKPGWSPAQRFCKSNSEKIPKLSHRLCRRRKSVGELHKRVLVTAASDYHCLPNRQCDASRSADFPSGWRGDRQEYTSVCDGLGEHCERTNKGASRDVLFVRGIGLSMKELPPKPSSKLQRSKVTLLLPPQTSPTTFQHLADYESQYEDQDRFDYRRIQQDMRISPCNSHGFPHPRIRTLE